MGVDLRLAAGRIAHQRGRLADGRSIYSLADIYHQADVVTYPSAIEGFGNAFLEAVYYGRPLVVNTYPVYQRDIRPRGFRVIEFEDLITQQTVDETRAVLEDTTEAAEIAEHNYALGRRYFSYELLERHLATLLTRCIRA
jgi:glycosyltransferase involved in cell wall biosynthesis